MVSAIARSENDNVVEFENELAALINRYSMDTYCNIQDFVLAEYLIKAMISFKEANERKEVLTKNG